MGMGILGWVFQEFTEGSWDGWYFYMGRLVGMVEGIIAGLGGKKSG